MAIALIVLSAIEQVILTIGITFFTLMLLLIVASKLYKTTNHYKNFIEPLNKFIKGVPEKLEIVNLGTSYSMYAFNYDNSGLKGFNMALQPQPLEKDFCILKQYTKNLEEGCIVLLITCLLSFGDNQEVIRNKYLYDKYYLFLDRKYMPSDYVLKRFIIKEFPFFIKPTILRFIIKDVQLEDSLRVTANKHDYKDMLKFAGIRIKGWLDSFNLKDLNDGMQSLKHQMAFTEKQRIVSSMIEFCLANRFRPIIIIPPVSSVLRNSISDDFVQAFLRDNISKANKAGIPVLDYWDDEGFCDRQLYIHCDFMNVQGRNKFTARVLEDIIKLSN